MWQRGLALGLLLCGALPLAAQGLWETFSNDYTANCLAWTRDNNNPVIPPSGSTWKSRWTANPELFTFGERTLLYYRGNGIAPGKKNVFHDRIGVAEVLAIGPMQLNYRDLNGGSPIIDVGPAGAFDDQHVLDPAVVYFKGQVHLFYSAVGHGPNSIGLATSANGERFTKVGKVLEGRAPDALVVGDTLYLLYQRQDSLGYKVYVSISTDGVKFFPFGDAPVFAGEANHWDSQSISTPRIWKTGEWYYMLYGGSADRVDEPEFFGLARSRNLLRWERHPGNPVFGAGAHASADGGAIWFPALYDAGSWIVLLYEGSRGKYSWDLSSGVCMAWIPKH